MDWQRSSNFRRCRTCEQTYFSTGELRGDASRVSTLARFSHHSTGLGASVDAGNLYHYQCHRSDGMEVHLIGSASICECHVVLMQKTHFIIIGRARRIIYSNVVRMSLRGSKSTIIA